MLISMAKTQVCPINGINSSQTAVQTVSGECSPHSAFEAVFKAAVLVGLCQRVRKSLGCALGSTFWLKGSTNHKSESAKETPSWHLSLVAKP